MLCVQSAIGERLRPAVELLFSDLPVRQRRRNIADFMDDLRAGHYDPRQLLLAEWNAEPVGVILSVIREAGVGLVWPPVTTAEFPDRCHLTREKVEDALLQEVADRLDQAHAWIGQAMLPPGSLKEHAALERNGFPRMTEFRFFERPLQNGFNLPQRHLLASLSFEPYRKKQNQAAFVNMLEATYRGTLDCPELNGIRDGRQSLINHEEIGEFTPHMWRLYRRLGVDVGVLLMIDRPDQQAWEILYLGVADFARGCGVGRAMLNDALHSAHEANIQRVLIAADARNVPAIRLYQSMGFQMTESRVAYVRLSASRAHNVKH
jgi:ribosomal protein S18 acetylase RimI-like enzyme